MVLVTLAYCLMTYMYGVSAVYLYMLDWEGHDAGCEYRQNMTVIEPVYVPCIVTFPIGLGMQTQHRLRVVKYVCVC